MKALQFSATGDLSTLRFVDVATPVPAAGDVLVQIKAAGLNPSDVKNVLGRFPYTTLPRIPGRDFAGVVVEGPQEWVGQAVWGTGRDLGFFADGSHAQYLTVSAKGVAHKPSHLSFAQAASLGVPYTTAWDALQRSAVGEGTRVLVIGANGAVGSAALALAKILGAQVRADQRNMPGTECADVIARHQLAAALADQVDLEFRVVIPARQFVGVVMFEPAKTVFRLGQDHFEFRGAVFEQLGAADGHGDASCTWGIAPKYACWRQPRYRSFRPILILF